jgi:hypothetical protein
MYIYIYTHTCVCACNMYVCMCTCVHICHIYSIYNICRSIDRYINSITILSHITSSLGMSSRAQLDQGLRMAASLPTQGVDCRNTRCDAEKEC